MMLATDGKRTRGGVRGSDYVRLVIRIDRAHRPKPVGDAGTPITASAAVYDTLNLEFSL